MDENRERKLEIKREKMRIHRAKVKEKEYFESLRRKKLNDSKKNKLDANDNNNYNLRRRCDNRISKSKSVKVLKNTLLNADVSYNSNNTANSTDNNEELMSIHSQNSVSNNVDTLLHRNKELQSPNQSYNVNMELPSSKKETDLINELQRLTVSFKCSKAREQCLRRKVTKLESVVREKNKKIQVYKSKYYRLLKKHEKKDDVLQKVQKIQSSGKRAVRNRLLQCEVLEKQMLNHKSRLKTNQEKAKFAQILAGKILKKYKMMKRSSTLVSVFQQRKYSNLNVNEKRSKRDMFNITARECVRKFLEKDEHSAISPRSKDTVTKNKIIKRKRFLLDSMDNLYKKFMKEETFNMSRSTFMKLRPFWIVRKKMTNRDTCLCKVHANYNFLIQKLARLNILSNSNTIDFLQNINCDVTRKLCMYGECNECKIKDLTYSNNVDVSDNSYYFEWISQKETNVGKQGKIFTVTRTIKKKVECTINDIINKFNLATLIFLKHSYDTSHQHKALVNIQLNLKYGEVKLVSDFSENYVGKYANEIQSVHFGASKTQFTLHTGAFMYKKENNEIVTVSFCTVSESLRHDACAIWAHLKPILNLMKSYVKDLKTIHFQSDGPSTQYKNKTNFDLFEQHCQQLDLNNASWNFTTPGHGKSIADASGGTSKSLCDRAVLNGRDVTSVEDIIDIVGKSKIKVFHVTENDILTVDLLKRDNIKSAPQSQKIFQLIWVKHTINTLYCNSLTCTNVDCLVNPPCKHFSLGQAWELLNPQKKNNVAKEKHIDLPVNVKKNDQPTRRSARLKK